MMDDHRPGRKPRGSGRGETERRRTLQKILGGAGIFAGSQSLPEHWTRPVISSVVLPVHAQTTNGSPGMECQVSNFFVRMQEFAVPEGTGNDGGDSIEVNEGESEASNGFGVNEAEFGFELVAEAGVNDSGVFTITGSAFEGENDPTPNTESSSLFTGNFQIVNGVVEIEFDGVEIAFAEIDFGEINDNLFELVGESESGLCDFQSQTLLQTVGEAEIE